MGLKPRIPRYSLLCHLLLETLELSLLCPLSETDRVGPRLRLLHILLERRLRAEVLAVVVLFLAHHLLAGLIHEGTGVHLAEVHTGKRTFSILRRGANEIAIIELSHELGCLRRLVVPEALLVHTGAQHLIEPRVVGSGAH